MSITYSFSDNNIYGTDDINNITKRLCGAGVAPFPTKETYNLSDLNSLTSEVTQQGVSLDGCRCMVNTENGENIITITAGVVFFQNGAALEVDEDGYELHIPLNSSGYVYAYFSTALQVGEIRFDETLPDDGFGVPLARVNPDNTIADCRSFARSKVATMGKNATLSKKMEFLDTPRERDGRYIIQSLPQLNISGYNYAVITATIGFVPDDQLLYFPQLGSYNLFWDIEKGKVALVLYEDGDGLHKKHEGYFYSRLFSFDTKYYYVDVVDGELCVLCDCSESQKEAALSNAHKCTVTLI